jgi:hypothetical protein
VVKITVKVIPSVDLSIMNPVSLLELSVHCRLIWVAAALPTKLLGAAGGIGGGVCVVSLAVFE